MNPRSYPVPFPPFLLSFSLLRPSSHSSHCSTVVSEQQRYVCASGLCVYTAARHSQSEPRRLGTGGSRVKAPAAASFSPFPSLPLPLAVVLSSSLSTSSPPRSFYHLPHLPHLVLLLPASSSFLFLLPHEVRFFSPPFLFIFGTIYSCLPVNLPIYACR